MTASELHMSNACSVERHTPSDAYASVRDALGAVNGSPRLAQSIAHVFGDALGSGLGINADSQSVARLNQTLAAFESDHPQSH
jgi:hypothetical protein